MILTPRPLRDRLVIPGRQRGFFTMPGGMGSAFPPSGGPPPAFPSSGLISYFKLDSNSNDGEGSDNGTDTSISYANAGRIGNCATFSSSKITFASGNPTTNNSVSLWLKRSGLGVSEQFLFGWFAADGVIYWRINLGGLTASRVGLFHRSAASDFRLWDINDTVADTTTWHHIVVTQAGAATPTIYYDGVSRSVNLRSTSGTATKWTGTVPLTMGSSSINTFTYFGGIDEVGLWNRVLTSGEVTDLYNGGAGITYP